VTVTLESDRALLEAFRRGDREALTRVFEMYVDDVAKTLRAGVVVDAGGQKHRVGQRQPESEIESLVHETFARAFADKARQTYDGIRPYGAWLGTIARNLLVDRARQKRKDARQVGVADLDDIPSGEGPDPTWRLEEEQLDHILRAATAELDPMDKEIFRLRVQEGASFKRTAEVLGTTEIVVRRRDTRMRVRLLELLRKEGFLDNATVRIGSSLLLRSKSKKGE
jgi:RNA polymerase sigma-70 factor (ECF subfamily)